MIDFLSIIELHFIVNLHPYFQPCFILKSLLNKNNYFRKISYQLTVVLIFDYLILAYNVSTWYMI